MKLNYERHSACTGSEHYVTQKEIPISVLTDRDARREAAKLRDFTSTHCGDPPPGYSAYDRAREVADRPDNRRSDPRHQRHHHLAPELLMALLRRKFRKRNLKKIGIGIGFCPFYWQWGMVSETWDSECHLAIGPVRISWRGWR